jgi:hypothetical protein
MADLRARLAKLFLSWAIRLDGEFVDIFVEEAHVDIASART